MSVYFMQAVDGGPVKIGYSVDVDRRRIQLESTYRKPLAILAVIEGGRTEERDIHDRFSHLRFGRTEQFRPASDLMAFIGRPLLVDQNLDAVEAMAPKSGSTRLPSDLVSMANVVASIENRSAIEVFDETMRPALTKRYKQALEKASKAVDKDEK